MATLFTALEAQVDLLVSADNDELTQAARGAQILAAIERMGRDRPYRYTDDVTGTASKYYGVAASLARFQEGFSRIVAIEYPAADITANGTPVYLLPEDWVDDYYKTVATVRTRYLFLPSHAPAATESMRITYTAPYTWEVSTETVSVTQTAHGFSVSDYVYNNGGTWYEASAQNLGTHKVATVPTANTFTAYILQVDISPSAFNAASYLAAGLICQVLATKYSKIGDSTISADSVAHSSKAAEFASRSTTFIKYYNDFINSADADSPAQPIAAFVNWDTAPGYQQGRQWIFHNGR